MQVNDISNLSPARDNIWYALATIKGEPTSIDDKVITENSYYWNGFFETSLHEDHKLRIKKIGHENIQIPKLSVQDNEFLRNALKERGFNYEDLTNPKAGIDFSNIEFQNRVYFKGYIFLGILDFENCSFKETSDFQGAFFTNMANFKGTIFEKGVSFISAVFLDFLSLQNTIILDHAYFNSARFEKIPPALYDAKVPENIMWVNTILPRVTHGKSESDKRIVEYCVSSYERLALMMSKQEKHHDRHMFWQSEMQARRQLDIGWSKFSAKAMNWLYEKFCNYGYGFERALTLWAVHIVLGAIFVFPITRHTGESAVNSLVVSFSNAHSFLGLNNKALKDVYAMYGGGWYFNTVWIFQGLFGIVFLFFLILTIRNRF